MVSRRVPEDQASGSSDPKTEEQPEHSHLTWIEGEARPDDPMFGQMFAVFISDPGQTRTDRLGTGAQRGGASRPFSFSARPGRAEDHRASCGPGVVLRPRRRPTGACPNR